MGRQVCDRCKSGFNNKEDLATHRKDCKKLIPCKHCGRVFNSQSGVDKHFQAKHSNKSRTKCPHCETTFSVQGSLKQHLRLVHGEKGEFKCQSCDFVTTFEIKLVTHMRKHAKPKFMCVFCDFGARTNALIKNHNEKYHSPELIVQPAALPPQLTLGIVSSGEVNGDLELEAVQPVEASTPRTSRQAKQGDTATAVLVQVVQEVGAASKIHRVITFDCVLEDGVADFDKVRAERNQSGTT